MPDDQRRSRTSSPHRVGPHRVTVLGSLTLTSDSTGPGTTVTLGVDARRLVAYLAVHPRPQGRATLAADLWPGVPAAAADRLLDEVVAAIDVPGLLIDEAEISLEGDVQVDLADAMGLVRALPEIPADDEPELELLSADILPGWSAAWIAVERERFRQLRLHAVEGRSLRLSAAGHHDEAIDVARSAVHAAPSRESARRALIEVLLAQGDITAAIAQHDDYQELLRSSVGGPLPTGLDGIFAPAPLWPVLRARRAMPRSAVQLPGLRSVRGAAGGTRRLVAGGSAPGTLR